MGWNDHNVNEEADLPPEAIKHNHVTLEINDKWLEDAPDDLQYEAMKRWFLARYEDPANQTPYSSEEGGYLFVWGGPYDPSDVIQERFSDVVPYEVMKGLIDDLIQDAGDEWAPIEHEGIDYEEELSFEVVTVATPFESLEARLSGLDEILGMRGSERASALLTQLAHSSIISALEAYLSETLNYWVSKENSVLRRFVAQNKDFEKRSLTLSEIFDRQEKLIDEVRIYLGELVWHRLDKVMPLMRGSLEIRTPDIRELMGQIVIRHDIVHRAGRTKDGEEVKISTEDVQKLKIQVLAFARAIEGQIKAQLPDDNEDPPF